MIHGKAEMPPDDGQDIIQISLDEEDSVDFDIQEVRRIRRPLGIIRQSPVASGARGPRRFREDRSVEIIGRRLSDNEIQILDERPRLTPPPTRIPNSPPRLLGTRIFRHIITDRLSEADLHAVIGYSMPMFGLDHSHPGLAIEPLIMERIERDNERTVDERWEKEKVFNLKSIEEKREIVTKEDQTVYTNDLAPTQEVGCELCGVLLGAGIPDGFNTDNRYLSELSKWQEEYRAKAPWFCSLQLTETDRELLKRVFSAKCGHVFCGRCVKNIGNTPRTKRRAKPNDITHPLVFAPLKCSCGGGLKRKFTELYL